MKRSLWCAAALAAAATFAADLPRLPSVPLVACDPYFSIWSPADTLAGAETTHWTGKPHRLASLARIDGAAFRLLGAATDDLPALPQTGLEVLPTRTIAAFEGAGVALTLTFMTPMLGDDLDVLSWPVTYVQWEARATDGKSHTVACYLDAAAEIAVNNPAAQKVSIARADTAGLTVLQVGSVDQPVLRTRGDDLRIDWGHFYVAAREGDVAQAGFVPARLARSSFATGAGLPAVKQSGEMPAAEAPCLALALKPAEIGAAPVARSAILAYDDGWSIRYFGRDLRPFWRRTGWEAKDLLQAAAGREASLRARCAAFDAELMADCERAGGAVYARLAALAYRQCFAGGKFVADANGQPLHFCKENHSNGCIGTSDVLYPMSPQFLLFGPTLTKAFLVPFMNYAASPRWRFPFAPHDLGTYPQAMGQVYGGGERTEQNQMPVEESGNLILIFAALAQVESNADFAARYWPQLSAWAGYLESKGFDPENQLCTDDFAGHLAHNVNLSAKAICALGAYGRLCALRGDAERAAHFGQVARDFAARWVREAADGDHTKLAFDRPGTWSQKYNLAWDRVLGLDLFPAEVFARELAHYRRVLNDYGVPLDSRKTYTKLDWTVWSATLTGDRADFEALVAPLGRFLRDTPQRAPMTDWYDTKNAHKMAMTARPVVGGVLLPLLTDRALWRKYAAREPFHAAGWAPFPRPAVTIPLVPTAEAGPATWNFVTQQPAADWAAPGFDDAGWGEGASGFGTAGTPGGVVRTDWHTADIWLRRTIVLPDPLPADLALRLHHDEEAEIFLNGVAAAGAAGYTTDYESVGISPAARAALKPGANVIAVHCRQTIGGQYIDCGLDVVVEPAR